MKTCKIRWLGAGVLITDVGKGGFGAIGRGGIVELEAARADLLVSKGLASFDLEVSELQLLEPEAVVDSSELRLSAEGYTRAHLAVLESLDRRRAAAAVLKKATA